MKSVREIRDDLLGLWTSDDLLHRIADRERPLSLAVDLDLPTGAHCWDDPDSLVEWREEIEQGCACKSGVGYRIEYRELDHPVQGRLRVPERIVFDSLVDLAGFLGRQSELALLLRRGRKRAPK